MSRTLIWMPSRLTTCFRHVAVLVVQVGDRTDAFEAVIITDWVMILRDTLRNWWNNTALPVGSWHNPPADGFDQNGLLAVDLFLPLSMFRCG